MQVLIVCTANRCRSVMAQALFDQAAARCSLPLTVASAGLAVKRAEPADPITIRLLQRQGLQPHLSHQSRRIQALMHHPWDLILVMEPVQRALMIERYPQYRSQIFCLDPALQAITDPYRHSWQTYQTTLKQMQPMVEYWMARLFAPLVQGQPCSSAAAQVMR